MLTSITIVKTIISSSILLLLYTILINWGFLWDHHYYVCIDHNQFGHFCSERRRIDQVQKLINYLIFDLEEEGDYG